MAIRPTATIQSNVAKKNHFRSGAMALGLLAGMLVLPSAGCQTKKQAPPPPPPQMSSADELTAIRADYPSWAIGRVVVTSPQDYLVAVGDVDPKQFAIDDYVTFFDASGNPINNGQVLGFGETTHTVHVRYNDPKARRAPNVGDFAGKELKGGAASATTAPETPTPAPAPAPATSPKMP